ncbi:MAG TPA: crosslink repair DNA glycosylase YcaQ family protein, partial [Verrucomicrobiae bacterium]|nr:crosslink repair DNA glycosylase YcaQ family protein [Verrucomicrobiae bacterium]
EAWPRAVNPDELHEALLLLGLMTDDEAARSTSAAAPFLESLSSARRAARMTGPHRFWVAAERWTMVQAIYPDAGVEPVITAPESERKRTWEREDALRELVRGRMEAVGPVTAASLTAFFELPRPEIDAALLALEGEGFILRGRFSAGTEELEWCDRRLLARIHRLTLNRLRAEIQPVTIADFQRFLLAWQRVDAGHRMEGPEGVEAVLRLLDGYELAASAWEPDVLAARVKEYTPEWLDRLCFTGRIGWGRLSPPPNPKPRATGPVRATPVCIFSRELLPHWLTLAAPPERNDLLPDTELVLNTLAQSGAMFFSELVRETGLLPSRVEQALAELVALGWATADSFEGLRALLVPAEKRAPFADAHRRRRHKTVTSVEFAGRWTLLRKVAPSKNVEMDDPARDAAIEAFAHVLLHRYGVMFRRLLEREAFPVSWYELGRIYRRLEARGEIRGGHFVSGVSGEQFALPEAIGLMRSLRKTKPSGELTTLSAADPLNLVGLLTPGRRITSISANRLLLRDGLAVAALVADEVVHLDGVGESAKPAVEQALRVGSLSPALRPYYA